MSISRCIFSILLLMQILWSCNVLEAPVLDEVSKIRPAHLLELALKNRIL